MATATSPVPDDRGAKRQKGDDNGNGSQGGPNDGSFPSRPPQHPGQMYPGYMGMSGGNPGPYNMGGAGMPPYGQYGGPHGPPPPHAGGMYGGMYGGGPGGPPVRGHASPERQPRPGGPPPGPGGPPPGPGGPGPWNGYRGGPPPPGAGPGKKDDKDGSGPPQQQHAPYAPTGGWAHPQSWQPGPPYGPPPGYGGHPSMPGAGMYGPGGPGGGNGPGGPPGGWNAGGPNDPSGGVNNRPPSANTNPNAKSPPRNRARPDSATPGSRQASMQRGDTSNQYCMDVGSVPGGRTSVTHEMGEEGSSISGSAKDKGRGSYKCGRCGVPKKGHICPYQPKLKRRPDEPPPETRNAAVQVEMDEFMTLRRLNIRIQGFPESYATEPFMGASMVGAEPHPSDPFLPGEPPGMMDDPHRQLAPPDGMVPSAKDQDPSPLPNSPSVQEREGMDTGVGDPTSKEEKTG